MSLDFLPKVLKMAITQNIQKNNGRKKQKNGGKRGKKTTKVKGKRDRSDARGRSRRYWAKKRRTNLIT